jgi:hypothetical protein
VFVIDPGGERSRRREVQEGEGEGEEGERGRLVE